MDPRILSWMKDTFYFGGHAVVGQDFVGPQVGADLRRQTASAMVWALLGLLATDIRRLARLRGPTRTVTTVLSGLRLARKLRAGRLHVEELEHIIARILLRDRLRDAPLEECVSFSIVSILSLAEDVDTEEEARALEG